MFHCGYLYVNKSMSVFSNVMLVFGSIVKFYVECFCYWLSYTDKTSSEIR